MYGFKESEGLMPDRRKSLENMIPMILNVEPLSLEVGSQLNKILRESSVELPFSERMAALRKEAALSLGLILPNPAVRKNERLDAYEFVIKVREIEIHRAQVNQARSLPQVHRHLERKIFEVIHRYAHEFLGLNDVQALISHLRIANPDLVGAVYPSLLNLPEIQRVLQNLLREGIPIRDLVKIFETLREYAVYTHDPDLLTEYARHSLARLIGSLVHNSFVIRAYLLDREIEQLIAGAIRWDEGAFLEFDSWISDKFAKSMLKRFRGLKNKKKENNVLLVSPDIRRFVRMLIERIGPEIPVISTNEISAEYKVKAVGVISLDGWWTRFLKRIFAWTRKENPKEVFPGDDLQKALLILNLIGSASTQVIQGLTQHERDALRGRAMVAPIPAKGKEGVIREFISFVPKEKKVAHLDSLIQFAGQEPMLVAVLLQNHWLPEFAGSEEPHSTGGPLHRGTRGRDETTAQEKAAVFISTAARWIQEEVYRTLNLDDLRRLGYGMLQFPFISMEAKRKAWDDYESTLHKDEWWDPETLARFVQASTQGKIEDFKKRGFRQSQKLAILLLSLPPQRAKQIGKDVLDRLGKTSLQQVLAEMGQWRDQIPSEARQSAVHDFLHYIRCVEKPEFQFYEPHLKPEVERIIHHDPAGAAAVMRNLWLAPPDPWSLFEMLALQMPGRVVGHLFSFYQKPFKENWISDHEKASSFVNAFHPDLALGLKEKLSAEERSVLAAESNLSFPHNKIFQEFLRGYYGGSTSKPLPFLKLN